MAKTLYVGIDLGGTKSAAGLVTAQGKIIASNSLPTFPEGKSRATVHGLAEQLADLTLSVIPKKDFSRIAAVGIASAGPMNVEEGVLLNPTNLAGWKRVPLVALVKKALHKRRLRVPIYFQNDAIAAALGEGWVGAARGMQTYAVITVGTGIGSGLVFRGQPAQFGGMGSEWGLGILSLESVRLQSDPWLGSTEAFASGTGILRRAQALGFGGRSLKELSLVLRAEKKYAALFDDAALALAILSHNLSLGFHPQAILFTGGVMNLREYFFPQLKTNYAQLMKNNPLFKTIIKPAKLGNEAGVIGAARLALL